MGFDVLNVEVGRFRAAAQQAFESGRVGEIYAASADELLSVGSVCNNEPGVLHRNEIDLKRADSNVVLVAHDRSSTALLTAHPLPTQLRSTEAGPVWWTLSL